MVTNLGGGISLRVNDETGDADNSPFIVSATGNVGIGTSVPANKLHVEGAGGGAAGIYISDAVPSIFTRTLYNQSGTLMWNGSALAVGGSVSGTPGFISRFSGPSSLGDSSLYELAGNVGLGSSVPSQKLDIVGTVKATAFNKVTLTAPATGSTLTILDGKTLTVNNTIGLSAGADSKTLNIGSYNLTFSTTADTTVGLPTTGTLVNTAVTSLPSLTGVGTSLTGVIKATAGTLANMTGTPGYMTRWDDANTLGSSVIYNSGANVGIGSSVPQAKLDVEGSIYLGSGNIGVGSAVPTEKVDVVGTVKATSFIGNGAGLTNIVGAISGLNAGYLPKSATATTINDSAIYQNGSNIGIGTTAPIATLDVKGSISFQIVSQAAPYAVSDTDNVILVDASGGSRTITLPSAVGIKGRTYNIKKIDATTNGVVISPSAGNIDGLASFTTTTQNQAFTVISDGTNWWII
jgi:hypothetical protein